MYWQINYFSEVHRVENTHTRSKCCYSSLGTHYNVESTRSSNQLIQTYVHLFWFFFITARGRVWCPAAIRHECTFSRQLVQSFVVSEANHCVSFAGKTYASTPLYTFVCLVWRAENSQSELSIGRKAHVRFPTNSIVECDWATDVWRAFINLISLSSGFASRWLDSATALASHHLFRSRWKY